MDQQQTNSGSGDTGQPDDLDQMLPPVQIDDAADQPNTQMVDSGQTMPTTHALVPTPEDAADSDLIEKEWVLKAKQIVEHTAEDPFEQQQEMTKMKADYLKKRYNKDINQPK